ncbi:DUF6313 family protein [Streptomyces sp. NPDC088810]|uniref:DUF6313 family protein n=1 Tax=Streptomyces sp. NPDC088810 TaxID=3365904 RepID=UPI00381DD1B0
MIVRSLSALHDAGGDEERLANQFAVRWHGSDWVLAEDHWERLVSKFLRTKEMEGLTAKDALRDSEQRALNFLMVHLGLQRSTCPMCRLTFD